MKIDCVHRTSTITMKKDQSFFIHNSVSYNDYERGSFQGSSLNTVLLLIVLSLPNNH